MCGNSGKCCTREGYQPVICVKDISRSQKPFLKVDIDAPAAAAVLAGADALLAGNMAQIGTKCVRLDPCCTSTLSFTNAANLADFLENIDPALVDPAAVAMQRYLTGKYACGQACC